MLYHERIVTLANQVLLERARQIKTGKSVLAYDVNIPAIFTDFFG